MEAAALVDALPMTGYDSWYVFDAEDHPRDPRQLALQGSSRTVSPGYFQFMGIRLLRGRWLNRDDESGASRAILVSEAEANQLWPGQDPIGKHLADVGNQEIFARGDGHDESLHRGRCGQRHASRAPRQGLGLGNLPAHHPRHRKAGHEHPAALAPGSAALAASLRDLVLQLNPAVPVTKVRTLKSVIYIVDRGASLAHHAAHGIRRRWPSWSAASASTASSPTP